MKMDNSVYLLREFTSDLVLTARLWRRLTREVTAQYGIAEAGVAPLLWIGRLGEGIRQHQIAERCGIEGASLVRVLDELSKSGLVMRRKDPADRRANALFLTDGGRAVVDKVEAEIIALRARVLEDVDPADLAAARRVLDAIKRAAGRIPATTLELAD
jgi:MarR family transcriptional regulator for hemolysin